VGEAPGVGECGRSSTVCRKKVMITSVTQWKQDLLQNVSVPCLITQNYQRRHVTTAAPQHILAPQAGENFASERVNRCHFESNTVLCFKVVYAVHCYEQL
jgi:hypothetical protein